MKIKNPLLPPILLISIGLLVVVFTYLFSKDLKLTDGQNGIFMGVGVGMEIVGILRLLRIKPQVPVNN